MSRTALSQSSLPPAHLLSAVVRSQRSFVTSRPVGCRTSSPSPRLSPQGRGGIIASRPANRRGLDHASAGRGDPLSLGERAGMRGNKPRDQKRPWMYRNLIVLAVVALAILKSAAGSAQTNSRYESFCFGVCYYPEQWP